MNKWLSIFPFSMVGIGLIASESSRTQDDPIVILDGKPIRRSQLNNPVEKEAPRKEPEVKVTVQVDGKAKCVT